MRPPAGAADRLGEQPKGKGVADASGPLVDGVEDRRRNDDGIRCWQDIGIAWLHVVAAHRIAGGGFQLGCVDEAER
jgi:hypothetical protein